MHAATERCMKLVTYCASLTLKQRRLKSTTRGRSQRPTTRIPSMATRRSGKAVSVLAVESISSPEAASERLENLLGAVSYTHLRAHETRHDIVCRLLLEKKK